MKPETFICSVCGDEHPLRERIVLDGPELSGQGVFLVHRRIGVGRQFVLVGQTVLLE